MLTSYTGVRVIEVRPELINKLYEERFLDIDINENYRFYANEYIVVKNICGSCQSAITKVVNNKLILLKNQDKYKTFGLKPRNKEQWMALDALLDDSIKIVILTGMAGSGKSLLSTAAALHKKEHNIYKRIIISKNMVQVEKDQIGFLKGDLLDKFIPFNQGCLSAFNYLLDTNNKKLTLETANEFYNIEYMPTAVIRGSSFNESLIIVDEVQNMSAHELLTTGTRVSEKSKIILLGDLEQIDIKVKKNNTGLFRLINSELFKQSSISAYIHLLKSERGEVAELFSKVFMKEE